MKSVLLRIPKHPPKPPAHHGLALDLFTPKEAFILLHIYGFRWRPRKGSWHSPQHPRRRVHVITIEKGQTVCYG